MDASLQVNGPRLPVILPTSRYRHTVSRIHVRLPSDGPVQDHRLVAMHEELPGSAVDIPEDALVIRFRPTAPEDVWRRAGLEYRRIGRYRLSVYADVKRGQETDDDLHRRLLRVSELRIDPGRNPKYFVCTQARELLVRGFTFWKDEDDDEEADEHYSVDLGTGATCEDMVRFLGAFPRVERRPSS